MTRDIAQEIEKDCWGEEPQEVASSVERLVSCHNCHGTGTITYNPNLNPNAFPGTASAKCTRCNGTGIEEEGN